MLFAGLDAEISCSNVAHSYWDSRSSLFAVLQKSQEIYSGMNDIEREIIEQRIKMAVEAMCENVHDWLPYSFSGNEGDCISVTFKLLKTQINSDVEEKQLITSYKLREASKDLQEIMAELEEEDEAINSKSEGCSD